MNTLMILLLVLFASLVFGIYYCLPLKHRHWALLVFSLVFYAIYSKFMTVFIVVTILSIYLAGLWLNSLENKCNIEREGKDKEERKIIKQKFKTKKLLVLWLFIAINLGMLIGLKYINFLSSIYSGFLSWFNITKKVAAFKIVLPLGISYYTLSAIGYMIDVERGKITAERNFVKVALFVSFFPQLQEGPFASYNKLAPQLYKGHEYNQKSVTKGLLLAFWGFFKVFVIANRFAIISDPIFSNYSNFGGLSVIIGALSYVVKLYAEFSGCIDIARGVSEMFGITLEKNFNQPFFSQSVSEFWRRWHISLGLWFKEYVFYSITMSKGMTKLNKKLHGKVNAFFELFIPSVISLFVVWVLNGLWHGPAIKYVVYGLYWYVVMLFGMCVEPLFKAIYSKWSINKDNKFVISLRIFRTFLLVVIGLMMFKARTLTDFGLMFAQIFKSGPNNLIGAGCIIDVYDFVWCIIGLASFIAVDIILEKGIDIREKIASKSGIPFLVMLVLFAVTLVFGAYGNGYVMPDPEYGGF